MNEIRVVATALFDPGETKAAPARITARAVHKAYSYEPPELQVVHVADKPAKSTATTDPGEVKAPPIKAVAKARAIATRVTVRATAKPRNYVAKRKAAARAGGFPVGLDAVPHDHKTAYSRMVHVPVITDVRQYVTVAKAISHTTYWRPLVGRDRKTATAKAVFGSFLGGRAPSFRWT